MCPVVAIWSSGGLRSLLVWNRCSAGMNNDNNKGMDIKTLFRKMNTKKKETDA